MEEVGSLKNKIVCDYCGTIYAGHMEKCPLCGSVPQQDSKPKRNEKKEESGRIPKPLMRASVLFLALSVVVMGWFLLGQFFPQLDFLRGGKTENAGNIECSALSADSMELAFTTVGQTQQLAVKAEPANCTDVLWFSSADESIVTVNKTGMVTAVAAGQTELAVSCGKHRISIQVTVTKTFAFENDMLTFDELDATEQLKVSGAGPEDFVEWTTTDRFVAQVDGTGKVTAVGNGACKVLATIGDVTLSANIKVEAKPETTEPSTEPQPQERIGTLNTDGVNLRSGPGKEYEAIGYCYINETITVLEMDGEWCKIRTSTGAIGYIMDKFIHYED